ncbi:MAG: NPCBM/NEW2 domain-containing protein [Thermanaeromonas sp.]|uniref:NPCBM/NEW2 domain-containing protein n=1 Tax=Thermanaeromonas sp. TaxID=2003697 RepID=UPI00243BE73C|nr:NPCBM/NEW2 domain-containing protein [Thermanaeromonas sp.]MCG0277598.1 NPCBM/NEW2 domain-containing protein [Thermanaeromonas sp.]
MVWRKYQHLSSREKFLVLLLVVVAGLFFVHRVVVKYQLPRYLQAKKELSAESARLTAVREAALKLPLLKEELARAEAEISMTRARLGLTLLDKEAFLGAAQPQDKGVKVLLFRPMEVEKRGSFNVQRFQVAVEGGYPQIENYLRQLENLPALLEIRDLKLAGKEGGNVEANFIVDFYELGDETASKGRAVALLPSGRVDIFLPLPSAGEPSGSKKVSFYGESHSATSPTSLRTESPEVKPDSRESAASKISTRNSEDRTEEAVPGGRKQSETVEYTFPARGRNRSRAGAPWLEGIRVLRNVGPFYYPADRAINIGGRRFEHGIVVDLEKGKPRAEAVLDLQAGYLKLKGFAGVEDSTRNSSGSFILRISGDERELFTSAPLKPGAYPQYIEIDVAGVNRLIIQVEWKEAGPGDYTDLKAALADMFFSTI